MQVATSFVTSAVRMMTEKRMAAIVEFLQRSPCVLA